MSKSSTPSKLEQYRKLMTKQARSENPRCADDVIQRLVDKYMDGLEESDISDQQLAHHRSHTMKEAK